MKVNYPISPEEIVEEEENKKHIVPYCHGEPMEPSYRYKKNGVIYRTFICNFCHRDKEVEWGDE